MPRQTETVVVGDVAHGTPTAAPAGGTAPLAPDVVRVANTAAAEQAADSFIATAKAAAEGGRE